MSKEKELTIALLTEKLEKLTGKKVSLKEISRITNSKTVPFMVFK